MSGKKNILNILFYEGEYKKILAILENEQRNLENYCLQAKCYYKLKQIGSVNNITSNIINKNPEKPEVLETKGYLFYCENQFEKAIDYFNRALELNPNLVEALINRGCVYKELKFLEKAIIDFSTVLNQDSTNFQALLFRGEVLILLKDYENALIDFVKVSNLYPDNYLSFYNLSKAHEKLNETGKAIEDLTKSIELNPSFIQAYLDRGILYEFSFEFSNAIDDFSSVIKLNKNHDYAYFLRAIINEKMNNTENAINDYSEALRINPYFGSALLMRADLYERKEFFEKAFLDYFCYICIDPSQFDIVQNSIIVCRNNSIPNQTINLLENKNELSNSNKNDGKSLFEIDNKLSSNNGDAFQNHQSNDQLENLFSELDSLIGLNNVKAEIHRLIQFRNIQKLRKIKGLNTTPISLHSVFFGGPGTGKTTVARLYGKLLNAIGQLETGHLIETDRSGLVANYIGQTATKTDEVVKHALGGVLFIDEAYSLYKVNNSSDFGSEAIEILLKRMEDYRDNFAVIVAGYTSPMDDFLNSNPGFKSRFSNFIFFDDYSSEELTQIFIEICNKNDYLLTNDSLFFVAIKLHYVYLTKNSSFGNARYCRNLFEQIVKLQATRISETIKNPSQYQLRTIEKEDIIPLLQN